MIVSVTEGVEYTSKRQTFLVDTQELNEADPTERKAKEILENADKTSVGWNHGQFLETVDHATVSQSSEFECSMEIWRLH